MLKIIDLILIGLLLITGIETIITFKKNENEKIEDIRKKLLIRIDIIGILTILIAIITIILLLKNIK